MKRWRWLYEWVDEGIMSRRSHGRVYVSFMRRQMLTVLWPFNYVVRLALWADYRWNMYRLSPTIIDNEIRAELEYERQRIRDVITEAMSRLPR